MEVAPVRIAPPGRGSRLRAVAAIGLPFVVLGAVVGAGAVGRAGAAPESSQTAQPASAMPVAVVQPGPGRSPRPNFVAASNLASSSDAGFPRRALGLPVWSVSATVRLFRETALDDRLVAIGGWLYAPDQEACSGAGDGAPAPLDLCPRWGALQDVDTLLPAGDDGRLDPQFPAGITIRGRGPGDEAAAPIPVVVIGGFADPRAGPCDPASRACIDAFVVEQIVWANGRWLGRPTVVAGDIVDPPTSEPVASTVAQLALRNTPTILSTALLPRDLLGDIDEAADRVVPAEFDGPLWYLRVMPERLAVDIRGRDVRWIVIDARTAAVLASHPNLTAAP
jgi:hypothetical protein